MYEEAFQKLDADDAREILEIINPALEGIDFDPALVTILAQNLSFYKGYTLYDMADYAVNPPMRRYAVVKGDDVRVLDWTNGPVYALNEAAPLKLDDTNIDDYVRFFFSYVRGDKGAFRLAENIDDIAWRDDPPPAARKSIGKMLVPLSVIEEDKEGYRLQASMVFKDALFQADIQVSRDGHVSLSHEEILLEDMPVLDDIFAQ